MKVTLGLLQHACAASPAENLKKTLALAEQAAKRGAKIICTQELFRSQYFCQSENHDYFQLAESIPGPSTAAFQQLAKKHKVVIIASLFEKRAGGLYHNTAVIIDAESWVTFSPDVLESGWCRCRALIRKNGKSFDPSKPQRPGSLPRA